NRIRITTPVTRNRLKSDCSDSSIVPNANKYLERKAFIAAELKASLWVHNPPTATTYPVYTLADRLTHITFSVISITLNGFHFLLFFGFNGFLSLLFSSCPFC